MFGVTCFHGENLIKNSVLWSVCCDVLLTGTEFILLVGKEAETPLLADCGSRWKWDTPRGWYLAQQEQLGCAQGRPGPAGSW